MSRFFDSCKKGSGWRNPPREKPGMCPPANHEVRWPNLGWGKEWKEDGDTKGNHIATSRCYPY